MIRPDDSSLTAEQYMNVRKEAERRLRDADAFGRFPTPVDDVMAAAQVLLAPHDILDDGFLKKMRVKAERVLKSAIEKVWGLFDATARMIFVDRSVIPVKQTFLKLHETGHASLPHQNKIFSLFEDCKKSLDPETSELFDREANVFASEVLFQLGKFEEEAADMSFGLKTPMQLSKRYGASVYASVRRYVRHNEKTCAVLVLNQPELLEGEGFVINLRRFIASQSFERHFGDYFPERFSSHDNIGSLVPIGRRMSRPVQIALVDKNGDRQECIAESFNSTYQVFILIHVKKSLEKSATIILPKNVSSTHNLQIGA